MDGLIQEIKSRTISTLDDNTFKIPPLAHLLKYLPFIERLYLTCARKIGSNP